MHEQVEVASLIGDVAESPQDKPALHIHIVLGTRDGSAMAGHLGAAHVRPTLEVIVTESPAHLRKAKDIIGIGLAFAAQEIEAIPALSHDVPLDYVLTEKQVYDFRSG